MQVVGYDPTPDAALYVARSGSVTKIPLTAGTDLDFGLGERHCAGVLDGTTHTPCETEREPYCQVHAETWICARCRGVCLKDEMDCFDPHVVYLAIVAPDHVKVGVTKAHRFHRRLNEQGADRGVAIRHVENGRIAREIETELMAHFPDRIPTEAKISGIARSVNIKAWKAAIEGFDVHEAHVPQYGLSSNLSPVPERIADGVIVGTKGRLLLLENHGTTYVTDLRDLLGTHLKEGGGTGNRQSSLGTFH